MAAAGTTGAYEWRTVLRHRAPLRWMHWINLGCMLVLVGSGLQIFNAHPALYWGQASSFGDPVFAASAVRGPDGKGRGITLVGSASFDTTGVLGVSARSAVAPAMPAHTVPFDGSGPQARN